MQRAGGDVDQRRHVFQVTSSMGEVILLQACSDAERAACMKCMGGEQKHGRPAGPS